MERAPSAAERNEPSDAEVVTRVRAGEREAYAILVRRYQETLYRYALGMIGNPDAAADVVQESLVKAYTSLARCRETHRFGAWLHRILRNRCLDYLKDRRRRNVPLEEGAAFAQVEGGPGEDLERAELRRAVLEALATLPEPQREAFLLKHVDERPYEEMADLLGASVSALKMRVKRARVALQAALGRSGAM